MNKIDSNAIDIITSQVRGTGIFLLSRNIFYQFLLASIINYLGTFVIMIPATLIIIIKGDFSTSYEWLIILYLTITTMSQMYIVYATLIACLTFCKDNAFYDTWNNHFIINNTKFDIKEITLYPLLPASKRYPDGFCILSFKLNNNKVVNTLHIGIINRTVTKNLSNYKQKINIFSILISLFSIIFIAGMCYIIFMNSIFK